MKNKQDVFPFKFSNDVYYLYVFTRSSVDMIVAHNDDECVKFLIERYTSESYSMSLKYAQEEVKEAEKFILSSEDTHTLGAIFYSHREE